MVRQDSAKVPFAGSNPAAASFDINAGSLELPARYAGRWRNRKTPGT